MTTDFKFCTFSIFGIDDLSAVLDAVKTVYKKLEENKATIVFGDFNINNYLNPLSGGAHLPKFCCWKNAIYKDKVFFISNYEDGLTNLCGNLRSKLKCELIRCSLSYDEYPMYKFFVTHADGTERILMAYKEDRWVFYETGTPLPCEDTELYKNRMIRKRLNNEIIYSYLNKLGIDFRKIDCDVTESFTVIRTKW